MAIQNILASTAFAGWSGWREGHSASQSTRSGDKSAPFSRAIGTHTPALKHPKRRPVVVDLIPEPKADEDASGHVPDGPKVEGEQDDDENSLQREVWTRPPPVRIPAGASPLDVEDWARTEKT